jgi:uncharacterized membrane protein required for colicin V production
MDSRLLLQRWYVGLWVCNGFVGLFYGFAEEVGFVLGWRLGLCVAA